MRSLAMLSSSRKAIVAGIVLLTADTVVAQYPVPVQLV